MREDIATIKRIGRVEDSRDIDAKLLIKSGGDFSSGYRCLLFVIVLQNICWVSSKRLMCERVVFKNSDVC